MNHLYYRVEGQRLMKQRHFEEAYPLFPASGLATISFNGPHLKSKFLAFIRKARSALMVARMALVIVRHDCMVAASPMRLGWVEKSEAPDELRIPSYTWISESRQGG